MNTFQIREGTIFLNIDDPLQRKWMSYKPNYTFGERTDANCRLKYLRRKSKLLVITIDEITIQSKLYGEYNYTNIGCCSGFG